MDMTYVASPTMRDFHNSPAFVRALIGPIGSGKSVACCIEMMRLSMLQHPNTDGVRKSRWVVVRNTYRELVDTTIQTFFDWFPEECGLYRKMDMKFTINTKLDDGTTLHVEFLFRALDKPQDIKKLLSLEVTGGWINEVREIPKQIIDMLVGRLGRYPNKRDGGATWHGLLVDTNPCDTDHWFYKLFEITRPDNHALFHQPSGISEQAENVDNLPNKYYENMQAGKDQEWINVYVHGKYGFVQDGKPVWPEYKDDTHSTNEPIELNPKLPIYIGIDFGLTPAAIFGQESASGRWLVFDELVTEDMGAKRFGALLNKHINRLYPGFDLHIYGDPAGDFRAQTDEITPFQILSSEGINAVPTYTNDVVIRLESVASVLSRLDFSGNPAFLIGPNAPMCRKALAGGYKYKRMAVAGQERFNDKPDKGRYSHIADALQYMMLGAGEGGKIISSPTWGDEIDYSHVDRMLA